MQFQRLRGALGLLLAWAVVFALFSILRPSSFPTLDNLETMARQTVIVGLAAIGMTFVIISGAIDLSVGSVVALVTVVVAKLVALQVDPLLAALGGIGAGLACGLVNGLLITRLQLSAFIITLGGLMAYRGLAKGLAREQKVDAPLTWLNDLLRTLPPNEKWKLFPPGVWVLIGLAVAGFVLLERTTFGRNVTAVGGNETAAELSGIRPARVRSGVFLLMGLFAGLAGLVQFCRLSVGDPTVAVGLELNVIAAVVIGGASLSGGVGTIEGGLLGAVIMTTISTGCVHVGVPNWIQDVVTGGIIVGAVALDRVRTARMAR
jgi:ribose transport system permease protein